MMFSNIYSYFINFYSTKPILTPETITQLVEIDETCVETKKNEEKIEENDSVDEKKVYYNNFKKKQKKTQKNKKNNRTKNKH